MEARRKIAPVWVEDVPLCSQGCAHFVERLKLDGTSRSRSRWMCLLTGEHAQYCKPMIQEMYKTQKKFKQLERFVKNAKSKAMKCLWPDKGQQVCSVFTKLSEEYVRLNKDKE